MKIAIKIPKNKEGCKPLKVPERIKLLDNIVVLNKGL